MPEPETPFDFDDDKGRIRMTRNVRKSLDKLAKNQEPSPTKNQNLGRLMLDQFNADRDKKIYFSEVNSDFGKPAPYASQGRQLHRSSNENDLSNEPSIGCRSVRQQPTPTSTRRSSTSTMSSQMPNSVFIQDIAAENACREWERQKSQCSPNYLLSTMLIAYS